MHDNALLKNLDNTLIGEDKYINENSMLQEQSDVNSGG